MQRSLRQLLSRLEQPHLSSASGHKLPVNRLAQTELGGIGFSQDGAPQVRLWQRAVAATVAMTLWLAPLQVSWHNATQSAAQLAVSEETQQARNSAVDWQFFASQLQQDLHQAQQSGNWAPLQAQLERQIPGITRVLLAKAEAALPSVQFGLRSALAGPITDPSAPIRFQPQITSTSGPNGNVPVVNITQPNANGISLNQYSAFNVDVVGLILNNSLTSGGSLLGGNVSANSLLNGHTATQIINQVTSQGSPSNIFGTIEVFGAPASVIVINPNGVNCTSCGFVNAPHITLTTGTPQFLSGPGGTSTSFDNASALAYNVQGGHIQIEGLSGASGTPGAGIEGTVGVIDLIGGSIGINAPLYAGQQVNLISGQQVVAQAQSGQGRAGSDYQVSSNGANTAASNTSAQNALQIDATAFGAVSAGQIKIIGTSQGLGVRNDGTLTASVGALSIDANGDVRVGTTYGQTTVGITSTGNVTANGDNVGEQGLTLAANGNLQVNGSMQSQQNVNLQAGGNISGSGGAVANTITATAGNSLSLGGTVQAANALNLAALGHDGTGDITLGGSVTAPNVTALNAARDITIDGSITSATTLALAATRNLTINGTAGSVGDLSLQGKQGGVTTTGNVVSSGGNVSVLSNTDANLGGQVYAAQNAQLQSQNGSINVRGTLAAQQQVNATAASNVTLGGSTQSGAGTNITATNGNVAMNGDVTSGTAAQVQAGQNITGTGKLTAQTDTTLTAGQGIAIDGALQSGGNLKATAGQNLSLAAVTVGGNAGGSATLQGANVTLSGPTTIGNVSGGNLTVTASQDATLNGQTQTTGQLQVNAGRDVAVNGSTLSNGATTLNAGRNLGIAGSVNSQGNTNLIAQIGSLATTGNVLSMANLNATSGSDMALGGQVYAAQNAQLQSQHGSIGVGGTLAALLQVSATAANNVTFGGSTQSGTSTNITATNGNVALNGDLTSGSTAAVIAGQNITGTGTLTVQTDTTLAAGQAIAIAGPLQTGGNLNVTAGQNLSLAALTAGGNAGGSAALQGANVTLSGPTTVGNASGGNLSVTASNDATLSGQTQTTGQLQVNAGHDINVNGSTLSNGATTLNASRNLGIAGSVNALGNTNLTAQTGTLTTTGNVLSMSDLNATSGNDLTLGGQVYAAHDAQLQSQHGSINVGGTLAAQQQLSAIAANNVTLGGTTQSGANTSIAATTGNVAMNGNMTSGGTVQVSAGQNITGTGTLTAQADTSLTAGQAIAIAGPLQTGGNLNATAGQNLSLAALTAGGNASGSATLQGANVTLSGPTTVGNASGGNLSVTASNDAILGGQTQTTGQLQVNAGHDINVNGSTLSNGATTLNASRNLGIAGSVNALGNTNLTAQTGTLTTTGNVLSMSDLNATSGSDLTLGGQVYAAHEAQLQSQHGSINVGGTLAAQQQLSAIAANNVTLGGTTQSGANTSIAATTGNVAMNGNMTSGGTAQVSAGQNITGTGTLVAQTDTTLTAGQAIAIAGALQTGGNLTATAGQNLSLAALTVGGNTGGSAKLQGANVQLSGPTVVGNASGGNLAVTASNDATLGGQTQTTGNLQVNAGRDINVNGGTLSNGATTLDATRSLAVGGTLIALGDTNLTAQNGSLTTTGSVLALSALNATSGGNLDVGGQIYAQNAATLQSQHGNVSVSGDINAQNSLQATAAGSTNLGGTTQVGGNAIIAATAGDVSLGGNLTGHGAGIITAGGNIIGAGNTQFTNNATLTAGNNVALAGSVGVGGNLNASAGNNLALGATTVLGNATLAATRGNLNLNGATTTGGSIQANAGTDLVAAGAINSLQNISLGAGRNLTTQSTIGVSNNLTASAGQALALNGVTTSLGNATLSGASIGTGGDLNVGGTLQATAQNSLNLTGGLLTVGNNANLAGADITLGGVASATSITASNPNPVNAIGGNLTATATNGVTIDNVGVVKGNATLNGANSVTNNGNWLAAGDINITTQQAVNNAGAALQSLGTATINATNLTNAGTIYGVTTNVNASNSVVNANGALLARDNLNVVTNNFTANQGGLLFAGDTSASAATPPTSGNVSLTVNGAAGSFNNTGGQILAANNVTLALPNQSIDPTAATFGTVDLNGTLTLIAQSINVNGNWNLPGSGLNLQASNGFTNTGTIQKSGNISISGASFTNSGSVIAGGDVTLNGAVTNQASGVIHADQDVNLGGTVVNAGKVEAVRDVNVSGASYDNTGGTTTANRDFNATLSGALTNVGSTITAGNNVNITAASVNNDRAAPVDVQNTTTTISDPTLLLSTVVGTKPVLVAGGCSGDNCQPDTYVQQNVTLGDLSPNLTTGTVKATDVPLEGTWYFAGDNPNYIYGGAPTQILALPTVQNTVQSQANGQQGLITAGAQTSITANTLSNRGSTISGNNVVLNVQSLDNGRSDTIITSKSLTTVNQAELSSFMAQVNALGTSIVGDHSAPCPGEAQGGCTSTVLPATLTPTPTASIVAPSTGGTTTALGPRGQIVANQDMSISGGNLVNAGNIVAGRDITFNVAGLTNLGENSYSVLTQGSLVVANMIGPGDYSDNFNPLSQSVAMTQDPATIVAGRNLAITAGTVTNNNANLAALGNVTITSPGTVSNQSGTIQATNGSVTINAAQLNNVRSGGTVSIQSRQTTFAGQTVQDLNQDFFGVTQQAETSQASVITSGGNLNITSATLNNIGSLINAGQNANIIATSAFNNNADVLPVTSFLSHVESAGGISGGHVRENDPVNNNTPDQSNSIVQAVGSLNVNGQNGQYAALQNTGTLSGYQVNLTGSSITNGFTNPQIVTPGSATPQNVIPLGPIGVPTTATNAQNGANQAAGAEGSTEQVNGNANLPTESPISAQTGTASNGNGATSTAPVGSQTASATTGNGATSTAPVGSQTTSATTGNRATSTTPVGSHTASTVAGNGSVSTATIGGQSFATAPTATVTSGNFHFTAGTPTGQGALPTQSSSNAPQYVVTNPASNVLGGLTPQVLLNSLPAALQPNGSVPFYYDPFTEDQQLQQAALAQAGNASFISGLAPDAQTQVSVTDQEKAVLYSNAISYATQNNIQVGVALSQQQINALTAPMLWYVEETVPDPSCKATGTFQCGTINALMPQVYLPQATPGALAGGVIQGNQVTLTATGTGTAQNPNGTVTNTGYISAQQLIINAGELDNEARSADIGVQTISGGAQGYTKLTGTEVQPGGFLSAENYQLNVDRVNSISGQFQQTNADGSVNQAGSQALLDNLQQQLGSNFTESTAQNNITQTWVQTKKADPTAEIVAIVAAIAISIVTAGAGAAIVGAVANMTAAEVGASVVASVASVAVQGAVVGTLSSAATQLITTGNLNVGTALESGAVSGITAGLTQGITYGSDGVGVDSVANDPSSLANLGGTQSVTNSLPGTTLTQAASSTTSSIGIRIGATVANSAIGAGVQTIIEGGSFGNALKNNLIGSAAAIGANWIGQNVPGIGMGNATDATIAANIASHALLGCAAASLAGNSCSAGAVGGATSAVVAPLVRDTLYNVQDTTTTVNNGDGTQTTTVAYNNSAYNAATDALAILAGGGIAAALGLNSTIAANAAANETINNATATKWWLSAVPVVGLLMTPFGPIPMLGALPIGGLGLPGKPSLDQQIAIQDGLLPPSTNQSGLFTNTGTSLPAWVSNIMAPLPGLQNQIDQWTNTILSNPGVCAVFATICAGLGVILSAGSGGASGNAPNNDNNSLLDPKGENHVLYGDGPTSGGHLSGVGKPGKSEFPATWGAQDITNAISDIATDPRTQWSAPNPGNGYITGTGTINGVDIRVVVDPNRGRIVTGYPTNLPRNPK
jgi:filamentous hemagglutinin